MKRTMLKVGKSIDQNQPPYIICSKFTTEIRITKIASSYAWKLSIRKIIQKGLES